MGLGDNFKGLPMSELIGAPLNAACDAQMRLAQAQLDFINKVGFEQDDQGNTNTRLIKFSLNRPADTPDGIQIVKQDMEVPFLGLVPQPSLMVEDVNIEFQMEVSAAESTKSTTSAEASTKASVSGGWFVKASVEVQGKVSSSRENTRSTNQTAKYQVRVSARQQQQTEGMSRMMDLFAQCVAPMKTTVQAAAAGGGGAAA
jgi:hypothetical protein